MSKLSSGEIASTEIKCKSRSLALRPASALRAGNLENARDSARDDIYGRGCMTEDVGAARERPAAPKRTLHWRALLGLFAALLSYTVFSGAQSGKAGVNTNGEEFFIISSVDITKKQLLVKQPTEITQLLQVNDKTRYTDKNGKAMQFADLRAGDTVYVRSAGRSAARVAVSIRKGPMTVEELHRRYLK